MSAGWYEGYRKFAAGESFERCRTAAELSGWLAAASGHAACETLDAAAAAGASGERLDDVLVSLSRESSIEDDYDWIRMGC